MFYWYFILQANKPFDIDAIEQKLNNSLSNKKDCQDIKQWYSVAYLPNTNVFMEYLSVRVDTKEFRSALQKRKPFFLLCKEFLSVKGWEPLK